MKQIGTTMVLEPQRKDVQKTIDKERAKKWLGCIDPRKQRLRSPDRVKRYRRIMDAGNWRPGIAQIMFTRKHVLFNGQHVLEAFIQSNLTTLTVLVSFNCEEDDWKAVDKVRVRTATDDLRFMGHSKKLGETSSFANVMFRYLKGFYDGLGYLSVRTADATPTTEELLEIIDKCPGIEEHLHNNPVKGKKGVSCYHLGSMRVASYLLHQIDSKRASAFFKSFLEGVNIPSKEHPIARLRQELLNAAGNKDKRVRDGETLAMFFKAWNLYLADRPLLNPPLIRAGEHFPHPLVRNDVTPNEVFQDLLTNDSQVETHNGSSKGKAEHDEYRDTAI